MAKPKRLKAGWTIEEEIGIEALNNCAMGQIMAGPLLIGTMFHPYGGMGREEPTLDREENALNNYLSMMCNLKEERCIEKLREQIPHYSIMWLEV